MNAVLHNLTVLWRDKLCQRGNPPCLRRQIPNDLYSYGCSKETILLTRFADSYVLQVGLLNVVEVLDAGDVEAISEAHVELLQLDLYQEMVQPLSVLVHQHHPTHPSARSKVQSQF